MVKKTKMVINFSLYDSNANNGKMSIIRVFVSKELKSYCLNIGA